MSNPFASWNPAMAEAHNARVAQSKRLVERLDKFLDKKATAPVVEPASPPQKPKAKKPLMNKLESAFAAELNARGHTPIFAQAITFRLGEDCRYTPDFVTFSETNQMTCWEVKGFMRDDARVKLHSAANKFHWCKFVLVTRDKQTKRWTEKVIGV